MLAPQVFFKGQMELLTSCLFSKVFVNKRFAMVNLLSFLVGDYYNNGYFTIRNKLLQNYERLWFVDLVIFKKPESCIE
jgi:hypothetical protein